MLSFRASSQPRDQTQVSCIAGRFFLTSKPLGSYYHFNYFLLVFTLNIFTVQWASLVGQMVKNLLAMQETQLQSLVQEDPQQKEKEKEKDPQEKNTPVFLPR